MTSRNSSKFLVGLLFGVLVGAIIWYWQKSTSAENGALALLDRLAAAERRLRELQLELSKAAQGIDLTSLQVRRGVGKRESTSRERDDLREVKGVGPVFEKRLNSAGIRSIRQLADCDVKAVASALDVHHNRAEAILMEARRLVA